MKISILSGDDKKNWPSEELIKEIKKLGHEFLFLNLNQIMANINSDEDFYYKGKKVDFDGGIIRSIGKGSTDQITFRISILEHINYGKDILINEPYAFRRAKDKYATLVCLSKNKIPVPKTFVTENELEAYKIAENLGDIVIKPLIGSRGLGPIRSNDPDLSFRIIKTLSRLNLVLYIQEYITKPNRDIRVFVIGDTIIGGIYREISPEKWKTNIAAGGIGKRINLDEELRELSIKTANSLNLDYTGIDILESKEGYKVIEANAAPSWKALQKVLKMNVTEKIIKHLVLKIKK